MISKMMKIYL